ncbi:MAG: DUF1801 domain-containing protein [Pseudomonadota bacterium]
MRPFGSSKVDAAFAAFPDDTRPALMALRDLIFSIAEETPEVTQLVEDLRWGQPSYLTAPRVGSTIRLGVAKKGGFGLFAHCQTTLISDFVAAYPGWDRIDGNRGVLFDDIKQIDPVRHGALIKAALTYHLR